MVGAATGATNGGLIAGAITGATATGLFVGVAATGVAIGGLIAGATAAGLIAGATTGATKGGGAASGGLTVGAILGAPAIVGAGATGVTTRGLIAGALVGATATGMSAGAAAGVTTGELMDGVDAGATTGRIKVGAEAVGAPISGAATGPRNTGGPILGATGVCTGVPMGEHVNDSSSLLHVSKSVAQFVCPVSRLKAERMKSKMICRIASKKSSTLAPPFSARQSFFLFLNEARHSFKLLKQVVSSFLCSVVICLSIAESLALALISDFVTWPATILGVVKMVTVAIHIRIFFIV